MRCEVYVYTSNNKIAHIIDEVLPFPTDANTTRIIVFDTDEYSAESAFIRSHNITWDGANLRINDSIYLSAAWIAARASEVNQADVLAAAKAGLRDKIALAKEHADTITIMLNMVLNQTQLQTVQPDRFNNVRAVITNAPQGFRDRVVTDVQQELGFDVTGTLTVAQQRQACLYLRMWCMPLAFLVSLA